MLVHCPSCEARYRVPDSKIGKRAKCSKCGQAFVLDGADEPVIPFADPADPPVAAADPPAPSRSSQSAAAGQAASPRPPDRVHDFVSPQPGGVLGLVKDVGRSFGVPFSSVANGVVFGIMWAILCAELIVRWGGALGMVGSFIIMCWYMAFKLNVVTDAAAGESDLPDMSLSEGWLEGVFLPFLKYIAVIILSYIPLLAAIVYAMVLGQYSPQAMFDLLTAMLQADFTMFTGPNAPGVAAIAAALLGGLLLGFLLQPMMLLVVSIGGLRAVFRFDLTVPTIIKIFPWYALVTLFYFTLSLLPSLLLALLSDGQGHAGALQEVQVLFAKVYCEIVALRAVGLLYHHFKNRFTWSWG